MRPNPFLFSSAGYPRRGLTLSSEAARGFTLLEVVIVVFLIGVIASFAALSVGSSQGRVLQDEARRLQALIKLARDEAVLQGEELAVEMFRNGYRFLRLEQTDQDWQWQPVMDSHEFRQRCLPQNLTMEAELEGLSSLLEELDCTQKEPTADESGVQDTSLQTAQEKEEEKERPRLFVLSSGELTPFKITIKVPEKEGFYRVVGDLTGKLSIQSADDEKRKS